MVVTFAQKLLAYELTLARPAHDVQKLTRSLNSAQVDLNPHQIDAALFAFRSPLSHGAVLAGEVGLGKTIEAGLVIGQLYAEGKRKILLLLPASVRKQWQNELWEKFTLQSVILDGVTYRGLKKEGYTNPFWTAEIGLRNEEYYDRELDKLETYSEEALFQLQDELKRVENEWKEAKRKRQRASSFAERNAARREVHRLEQEFSRVADQIAQEKKRLFQEKDRAMEALEKRLKLKVTKTLVATAAWRLL